MGREVGTVWSLTGDGYVAFAAKDVEDDGSKEHGGGAVRIVSK